MLQQPQPKSREAQEDSGWERPECAIVAGLIALDTSFATGMVGEGLRQSMHLHVPSVDLLPILVGAAALGTTLSLYPAMRKLNNQDGWDKFERGLVSAVAGLNVAFIAGATTNIVFPDKAPSMDLLNILVGAAAIASSAISYKALRRFGQ